MSHFIHIRFHLSFKRLVVRLIVLAFGCVLLTAFLVYRNVKDKVRFISPPATALLEDRYGNFLSEGHRNHSDKIGYWKIRESLPDRIESAFLAIEDKRFYQHSGVDTRAMLRALWNNVTNAQRQGASTIAMQVARMQNSLFSPPPNLPQPGEGKSSPPLVGGVGGGGSRTYWNKLCESITALLLIRKFGHQAVLRHYLKIVPQGNRIHGVAYAARRYFRKPIQDVSWAEAAVLASLPKAPGKMNLFRTGGRKKAFARAQLVLKLLHEKGTLTAEDMLVARRQLSELGIPAKEIRPAHSYHAILRLEEMLREDSFRPIRTSPDLHLQEKVSEIAHDAITHYRASGAGNIAALVVEKETGKVRAYLGSADYYDAAYAGAIDYVRVPRSSGSTLKPFIYALGLERGEFTPASLLSDAPLLVALPGGYHRIGNYDGRNFGLVLYRKALANSRNVPAIHVLMQVGIENAYELFRQLGLVSGHRAAEYYGLGMAIGTLYVTLEDLVTAYGVLANEGKAFRLRWFEEDGGQRSKVKGQRLKVRGQRSKVKGQRLKVKGQRLKVRGQRSKVKGQRLKVRGQRSKVRGQRLKVRGQREKEESVDLSPLTFHPPLPPEQWMSRDVARQISLFLSDPLARLPVFSRMGPLEYLFPVAVKTGTSQGFRDAWAIAYSSKYLVGVWIGHPDHHRMNHVSGQSAAQVVKRIMRFLHPEERRGVAENIFPPPEGYKLVRLCAQTGRIATEACPEVVPEYFRPGAEPASQSASSEDWQGEFPSLEGLGVGSSPTPNDSRNPFSFALTQFSYEQLLNASITIQEPRSGTTFVIDPDTPRMMQTLSLRADVRPRISKIVWHVDGKPFETTSHPYTVRWPLMPGNHTIQARFAHADIVSDVITITVY